MKAPVRRADASKDPYLLWNTFVYFLAHANFSALEKEQRAAYLLFWYDSEVQNGGHLQFFLNRPEGQIKDTVPSLYSLGCVGQAEILERAADRWSKRRRANPRTVEDYVAEARLGEFEDFDTRYFALTASVTEALEMLLEKEPSLFLDFQ